MLAAITLCSSITKTSNSLFYFVKLTSYTAAKSLWDPQTPFSYSSSWRMWGFTFVFLCNITDISLTFSCHVIQVSGISMNGIPQSSFHTSQVSGSSMSHSDQGTLYNTDVLSVITYICAQSAAIFWNTAPHTAHVNCRAVTVSSRRTFAPLDRSAVPRLWGVRIDDHRSSLQAALSPSSPSQSTSFQPWTPSEEVNTEA